MTFAVRQNINAGNVLRASLPADGITDQIEGRRSATLYLYVTNSGTWYTNGFSSASGTWKTGGGTTANYWAQLALSSGYLDPINSAAADTWYQLSTTRQWGSTIYAISDNFIVGTLSISSSSTGSPIIASCFVALSSSAIGNDFSGSGPGK